MLLSRNSLPAGALGLAARGPSFLAPSPSYALNLASPTTTTKSLLLLLLALVGAYLISNSKSFLSAQRSDSHPSTATVTIMTSPSTRGWHARAIPHPSASSFTPSKDTLIFAVLLSAQADPDGFTMALFRPDVVIDARGRVLQLQPADASALTALAQEAARVPDTGSFMNTWRVAHERTEQKIDKLFVVGPTGDNTHTPSITLTSVQGWHPEKKKLTATTGGQDELPSVLHELFGYLQEGRTGYRYGEVDDPELIAKVKTLVKDTD